jgi:hypothetical protein
MDAEVSCSSAVAFFDKVRRRSSRVRPGRSGEGAALLEVELESGATSVRGILRLHLEDGSISTRHVTGVSCEAVVDALALTAALALDSAAADGSATPAPAAHSTPRTAQPAPSDASEPETGVALRDSELGSIRPELGAHAAVTRVVAPHLNVGGALVARLRLERGHSLSPSLGFALLHTDNGLFESSRHANLQLTGVAASLCPLRWRPAPELRIEPCLTALGGQLRAAGRNLVDAREVTRSWWGAGALARAAFGLGAGVAVELEAGALRPLVDRAFVALPGQTSLGDTPAIAPFANLGIIYVL